MSSSRRVKKRKKTQPVEASAPVYPPPEGWFTFKDALSTDHGNPITSETLAALAATYRENHALFQPILNERVPGRLHHAIAFGDENLAMRILTGNIAKMPSLLLDNVTFKEPSGHLLKGTVYQWALKCHDVEMCKMMDEHFKALPNWLDERKRQIKGVFPNGVKACFDAQKPYDFTTLVNIITDSSDADIQSALRHEYGMTTLDLRMDEFRYKFAKTSQQEGVFNPQHILKALTIYTEQFDNWDWNRRGLFWRQIYGYVFRFAPACYKQVFCHGLYNLTEKNLTEKLARKNTMENCGYYPAREVNIHDLDSDLNCRSGFHFAVYSGTHCEGCLSVGSLFSHKAAFIFRNLFQANASNLQNLCGQRVHRGIKRRRVVR